MSRKILLFEEYIRLDSIGLELNPYYDYELGWFETNGNELTLEKLGNLYKIDKEELTILKLTYG